MLTWAVSQIYLNYFEIKQISDNHIMSTECDKIDSRISDVPQLTQLEKGKQLCVYQGLCPFALFLNSTMGLAIS